MLDVRIGVGVTRGDCGFLGWQRGFVKNLTAGAHIGAHF